MLHAYPGTHCYLPVLQNAYNPGILSLTAHKLNQTDVGHARKVGQGHLPCGSDASKFLLEFTLFA